jgi:hypothetical protein
VTDPPSTKYPPCPAKSPQSGLPCSLPDARSTHPAGHESAYVDNSRACWASTWDDHLRWALADVHVLSDEHEEKHAGRRPRRGCPQCIDSDRVIPTEALLRAVKARRPAEMARLILAADDLTARPSLFPNGGLIPGGVHISPYIGPPPGASADLTEQALIARRARRMRGQ